MPPTIKDVARIAGCSIKTVSRVINNEPYVTNNIRQRVLAAIRSTGYAPNMAARQLVKKKPFAICILLYPGFHQPGSTLFSSLLDIGYENNYQIIFQTYYPNKSISRDRLADLVNQRSYAGYIITPPCDADGFVIDLLATYKIPIVLINPIETDIGHPYVCGSDYDGARQITRHLIDLGHADIAFLKGPRNMKTSQNRLDGFLDMMHESKINVDNTQILESEFTFDGGINAIELLMQRKNHPTAVFAGNDESAYGVMFGAQRLGLNIPGDLSIAGFEDQLYSGRIFPGLTTYHLPADDLLLEAVKYLIGILNNQPMSTIIRKVDGSLIVRGSTSSPANKH